MVDQLVDRVGGGLFRWFAGTSSDATEGSNALLGIYTGGHCNVLGCPIGVGSAKHEFEY